MRLKCQISLALTQVSFAIGTVYFKYSVNMEEQGHKVDPIVFAFLRELSSAILLCIINYFSTDIKLSKADNFKVRILGLLLYLNQLFYILGVSLSGVIIATCMQPTIPAYTMAFALCLGLETSSTRKLLGIFVACIGAATMVILFHI